MIKKMTTYLFFTMMTTMLVLLTSGCGRKHVVSSPPAHKPARVATPAATPKPEAVKATQEIIEETYVVDAPKEAGIPEDKIMESDLADEPATAKTVDATTPKETGRPAATATETKTTTGKAATATSITESATAPQSNAYSIQVGAFSDLENANRALAYLLSEGYKGSRLSRTDDGLFRVQTGPFPDESSAREALSKLQTHYPKGFVHSISPKE
ncbi:MAG: SPOR domain-containing protein [Pseudodesulfovibrio sp.]|nr:SPOR domain-containing protein [Pseudodesulfovibrio sp.]